MHEDGHENVPADAPLSAEEGIDMEDATFPMPDSPTEAQDTHENAEPCDQDMQDADPDVFTGEMVDMLTLMDCLQNLGVSAVDANRYVVSLVKSRPSFVEMSPGRDTQVPCSDSSTAVESQASALRAVI